MRRLGWLTGILTESVLDVWWNGLTYESKVAICVHLAKTDRMADEISYKTEESDEPAEPT